MPKHYKFDENLLLEQAFAYTPPPEPDVSQLRLPCDWHTQFIGLCEKNYQANDKARKLISLQNKISADSDYTHRDGLTRALALIFYRLTGMLDNPLGELPLSEQQLIIDKLLEGAHLCMPGFHDRVEAIAQSMAQPQTLAHYLYRVRKSLVLKVAARLSDEVHTHNHVTVIASLDGLGVKPLFKDDPHDGGLTDSTIRQALQTTYQHDFVWFKLPTLLCDELRGILMTMGYSGNAKRIKWGTYRKLLERLEALFDLPPCTGDAYRERLKNFFVIEHDDSITNINWAKIKTHFYNACVNTGIIKKDITCHTLLNCAVFATLEKAPLNDMLNKGKALLGIINTYEDIMPELNVLNKVNTFYPAYYNALDKSLLTTSITNITQNEESPQGFIIALLKQPQTLFLLFELIGDLPEKLAYSLLTQTDSTSYNAFRLTASLKPAALPVIFEGLNKLNLDTQKTLWMQTDSNGDNILTLAVILRPAALPVLFKGLSILDFNTQKTLWTQTNSNGDNVLTLAVISRPAALPALFESLSNLDLDTQKNICIQRKNGNHNVFMLAVTFSPAALPALFKGLSILDFNTQKTLWMQTDSNGDNVLTLAVMFRPAALPALFKGLSNLDLDTQKNICIQRKNGNYNVFMLAVILRPAALPVLFKGLSKLDVSTQKTLWMQTDRNGDNALMLAAFYKPSALPVLFEGLSNLDLDTQKTLWMQTDSNGDNALMLATTHHPDILPTLLKTISSLPLTSKRLALSSLKQDNWNTLLTQLRITQDLLQPLVQCIEALPDPIKNHEKSIFIKELCRKLSNSKTEPEKNKNQQRLNIVFNTLTNNRYKKLNLKTKHAYIKREKRVADCRASFFCPHRVGSFLKRRQQALLSKNTSAPRI